VPVRGRMDILSQKLKAMYILIMNTNPEEFSGEPLLSEAEFRKLRDENKK